MKATLPHPEHESYLRHRRQLQSQILLPMILAALIIIGAAVWIGIAAFQGGGNVAQWGAVAAIWIVAPLLIMILILSLVLGGLVFLMSKLLGLLPGYTNRLQDIFYRIESMIRRFTNILVKPVFGLQEVGATIRALIGRR